MKTRRPQLTRTLPRVLALVLMVEVLSHCAAPQAYETMPPSQVERQIKMQAIGGGALLGAGVGFLLTKDGSTQDKLLGTLGGAAAGAAVGGWVGEIQVQDYRGKVRRTNQLALMVKEANVYNAKVAAYNKRLRGEIASIQRADASQRAAMAASRRRAAQASLRNVDTTISLRKDALRTIPSNRQGELRNTITALESRKRELSRSIDTLLEIEGEGTR